MTLITSGKPHPGLEYAVKGEVAELRAENERLRAALKPFADFDCRGWSGPMLKGFSRMGQEALIKGEHFDAANIAVSKEGDKP